jgi:hypothetical protein
MATNINLYVDQGIDYAITVDAFDVQGLEMTIDNQIFTCRARKVYSSAVAFSIDITVDLADDDTNSLTLKIPSISTLYIKPGKYRYDLIMSDAGGGNTKLIEGLLTILPTISL